VKIVSSFMPDLALDISSEDDWLEMVSLGTTFHDSLYRAGKPRTKHPFFARSIMDLDCLAAGIPDQSQSYHGVVFKNPLVAKSKSAASLLLLGEDIVSGLRAKVGEVSEISRRILETDDIIGNAAAAAGFDSIVYPCEVQVLDTSLLPTPEPLLYNDEDCPVTHDGLDVYHGIGWLRIQERRNLMAV